MKKTDNIYLLSRRDAMRIMSAGAASLLVGCGSDGSSDSGSSDPLCVVKPQQTEGPYFVDEMLNRSDIRSDPSDDSVRDGIQLDLAIMVSRIDGSTCAPLAGAVVDIWHCDALGVYSDVSDPQFNTIGKKFLRGYQLTDAGGQALFTTIYPGWYAGRAVHIHFKIRTNPGGANGKEFTSQLYFPDALTGQVHAQSPYDAIGARDTTNSMDGIFTDGGTKLILAPSATAQGYSATFVLGLKV